MKIIFFFAFFCVLNFAQSISPAKPLISPHSEPQIISTNNKAKQANSSRDVAITSTESTIVPATNTSLLETPEQAESVSPTVVKDLTRCPEKCTCSNGTVDCTKAGKTAIPSINELPTNTKVIDLSYNQIKRLSKFDLMPNLIKLVLAHNSIEDIEPEVFQSSTGLKELDLSYNVKIRLPETLLEPLHNLKRLKLTNCNISKLNADLFKENEHLTHLYLDSNPLYIFKKQMAKYLKDLQYLDVKNTKLDSFEIASEYPMTGLKTLDLSENHLDHVPYFKYAPNIETLILDYNRIGALNQDSFIDLNNLRTLYLSNNDELLDVDELTFARQTNLRKLVLSNNNHLFLISSHAFYGMYNKTYFPLKELNLQRNSLHYISESLLTDHWDKLEVLDLRLNPFNCDCHLNWLHKYKSNRNVSELRCALPQKLAKKRLIELDSKSMVCPRLIDSLLYEKLRLIIQGFIMMLILLVFMLGFLLLYLSRERQYNWMRLFGSPSTSTIYYQKANTKEQPIFP